MSLQIKNMLHIDPRALRDLMAEEASMWRDVLRWDYRSTVEFLKSFISRKLLPGYVVFDGKQAVGYLYMILDGGRGIIGNVYVQRKSWGDGMEKQLVASAVEALKATPGIDRIEAQLMLFSGTDLKETFQNAGFEGYQRHFLSLDIRNWRGEKQSPPDLEIVSWHVGMISEASKVVFDSYIGGIDAHFSYNFSRREKCLEFVNNLVQREGCGKFLQQMTTVGFKDRRMTGVVIATGLSRGTGHLPQISVAPDFQGEGAGSYLVAESLRRFKAAKYRHVSLTVTERNEKAYAWYRRIGFEEVLPFNAYLWLRSGSHS